MGSSKFRQRFSPQSNPTPMKPARAIRSVHVECNTSGSESEDLGSETEMDSKNVCVAIPTDRAKRSKDR